jgi:dienelactone hydrolase
MITLNYISATSHKFIHYIVLTILCLCFVSSAPARDSGLGRGKGGAIGQSTMTANGMQIKVFTYHPQSCNKPSILFVFHGLYRKAESGRNKAMKLADEACLVVFAPLFDKDRFPNWRYHRAGVIRSGRVQPRLQWTAPVVNDLIRLARDSVTNPDAKVYLFGHSAGGQILSRISAYSPPKGVDRIVIANPSVHVTPLQSERVPYGFDGLFSAKEALVRIKEYLALPVVIYLGQEDTGEKNLVKSAEAMRMGRNRLERGRNTFVLAKNMAKAQGWPFNWTLIEVPNVGHSSGKMLRNPALKRLLTSTDRIDN